MTREESIDTYHSLCEMLDGGDVESATMACDMMNAMIDEDKSIVGEKWFYFLYVKYVNDTNVKKEAYTEITNKIIPIILTNEIKEKIKQMNLISLNLSDKHLFK